MIGVKVGQLHDAVFYGFPYKLRPKPKIATLAGLSLASYPGHVPPPTWPGFFLRLRDKIWERPGDEATLAHVAQDCPAPPIDSLTGYYILTLVRIVLASGYPFLPSYGKGELWNAPSKCSTVRVRIATPTGNIPETSEVGTPRTV